MKFLFFLSKFSYRLVFLSAVSALISGLSSAALIGLIQKFLQGYNNPMKWTFFFSTTLIIHIACTYFSIRSSAALLANMGYQLRTALIHQFISAPFEITEHKKESLFSSLTMGINTIADGIIRIPAFVTGIGILIGCLIYLFFISWKLVVGLVAILLSAFLCILVPRQIAYGHSQHVQTYWNTLYRYFQDLTNGIRELLLNSNRARFFLSQEVEPLLNKYKAASVTERIFQEFLTKTVDFFLLGVLGFSVVGIRYYPIASTSQFTIFLTTLLFAIKPISSVTTFLVIMPKVHSAIDQILTIGISPTLTTPQKSSHNPIVVTGNASLIVKDLVFQYSPMEDHSFKFGPVSATFNPGEITFIRGGNGSGKSTLSRLLCGLYLPEFGEIWFGDTRLNPSNQFEFHQLFSVIFSDFFLFESILDADNPNTRQKANDYLGKLDLSHKVKIKKHHFSTVRLSQGQRKRLALVGAYLEDRPIYIFDEWAADQDPEFKKIFYHDILPELKNNGKIVIAITHDETYFDCADQLIELSEGKVSNR